MKVSCSNCKKAFNISEHQIYDYKLGIIISCPECNEDIEIDLETLRKAVNESAHDLPFGDE